VCFHIRVSIGIQQAEAQGENPGIHLLTSQLAFWYTRELGESISTHARVAARSGIPGIFHPYPAIVLISNTHVQMCFKIVGITLHCQVCPLIGPISKNGTRFQESTTDRLVHSSRFADCYRWYTSHICLCLEHKLFDCKCFEANYRKSELISSLGGMCTRPQQNRSNWKRFTRAIRSHQSHLIKEDWFLQLYHRTDSRTFRMELAGTALAGFEESKYLHLL